MLTDGRTDGRKVITIAHPEHSSGELKMTCASGAVICASAQSDLFSPSARRNLGPSATHRARSQTDRTANIHVDLNLP